MSTKLREVLCAVSLGSLLGGFHQVSAVYNLNIPFDIIILAVFLSAHLKHISVKWETFQYLLFAMAYYALVLEWIPGTLIHKLEWGPILGSLGSLFVYFVSSLQLCAIPALRCMVRKLGVNSFIAEVSIGALTAHYVIPSIVGGFQVGCFILNSQLLGISDKIGFPGVAAAIFFVASSLALGFSSLRSLRHLSHQLIYPLAIFAIGICFYLITPVWANGPSKIGGLLSVTFLNDDTNRSGRSLSAFEEGLRRRRHLSDQFRITEDYFKKIDSKVGQRELIVWPQGSLEMYPDIKIRHEFEQLTAGIDRPLFLGAYISPEKLDRSHYQHTAVVWSGEDGKVEWNWRRKQLTIPFVETQARGTLPFILVGLQELGRTFSLGILGQTKPQPLTIHHQQQKLVVDSIMCYEALFSDFVRAKVSDYSELMILTTNDNWWSKSKLTSRLMILAAQLRARENGIYVVRTSQAGGNYLINPEGELVTHIAYRDQKSIGQVTIEPYRIKTVLRTVGPTYICVCIGFGMVVLAYMIEWVTGYFTKKK